MLHLCGFLLSLPFCFSKIGNEPFTVILRVKSKYHGQKQLVLIFFLMRSSDNDVMPVVAMAVIIILVLFSVFTYLETMYLVVLVSWLLIKEDLKIDASK